MNMWMEHALKAQKLTSNSKQQQLGAQKGTGETPSQVASVATTNSINAQKVASASQEGILRKGAPNPSIKSSFFEQGDEEQHQEGYAAGEAHYAIEEGYGEEQDYIEAETVGNE